MMTICKLCNRYSTQCTNVWKDGCSCPVIEQLQKELAFITKIKDGFAKDLEKLQAEIEHLQDSGIKMLAGRYDELQAENHELLLADKRNTEICEKFEKEIQELVDERNHLSEALVQANLDIIRQTKTIDRINRNIKAKSEHIIKQKAEIARLKAGYVCPMCGVQAVKGQDDE
jgi:chromosome segregation ATPase